MCLSIKEANGGPRRCDCDNSVSRQERRVTASARSAVLEMEGLRQGAMPHEGITHVATLDSIRAKIEETVFLEEVTLVLQGYAGADDRYDTLSAEYESRYGHLIMTNYMDKHVDAVLATGKEISAYAQQEGIPESKQELKDAIQDRLNRDPDYVQAQHDLMSHKHEYDIARAQMKEVLHQYIEQSNDVSLTEKLKTAESFIPPDSSLMDAGFLHAFDMPSRRAIWFMKSSENIDKSEHLANLTSHLLQQGREVRTVDQEMHSARARMENRVLEERGDFYKRILSDARNENFGGDLVIAADSDQRKNRVLKEAITAYPESWVKASNQYTEERGIDLRIKHTANRAHYNDAKTQFRTIVDDKWNDRVPAKDFPDHESAVVGMGYEAKGRESTAVWETDGMWHHYECEFQSEKIKHPYEKIRNGELHVSKPSGNRWRQVRYQEPYFVADSNSVENVTVYDWMRTKRERTTYSGARSAELTISHKTKKGSIKSPGYADAVHELSHRMEYAVSPTVARLEGAFLAKRAGDEELSQIYASSPNKRPEMGYRDSFSDHYIGKVYQGESFEILSTGTESIFGGSFGGLVGGHRYQEDNSHRDFTLGMLATVQDYRTFNISRK